jgi:hypothetical protein
VVNVIAGMDDPGLPVIGGEGWFDADGKPFVLRVEYPLTFDEMVAAVKPSPPTPSYADATQPAASGRSRRLNRASPIASESN